MGSSWLVLLAAVGHGDAKSGGIERVIVVEMAHVAVEFRIDAAALARARYELVRDAAQHHGHAEDDHDAEDDVGDGEPGTVRIAPIQEGHILPPLSRMHLGVRTCNRMETRERGLQGGCGVLDFRTWKSGYPAGRMVSRQSARVYT